MYKNICRKIIFVVIVCITPLLLTGCVKSDVNITIDSKDNAYIEDVFMLKNEIISMAELDSELNNLITEINSDGNSPEKAEEIRMNGYKGVKIKKSITDISKNDISSQYGTVKYYDTNHYNGKLVNVNKSLFTSNYDINIVVDYSVTNKGYADRISDDVEKILEFLESEISIKIPVKADRTNADSIDDVNYTYKWYYNKSNSKRVLTISYTKLNIVNIVIASLSLLFIFILVCCIVFIINRRKLQREESQKKIKNKKCPFCGQIIKEEAQKCRFCGKWLNERQIKHNTDKSEDTKKCPYCNETIKSQAIKCRFCGKWLEKPVPDSVIDKPKTAQKINSNTKKQRVFPLDAHKFNWGAFWGGCIWGLGNHCFKKTYTYLIVIPIAYLDFFIYHKARYYFNDVLITEKVLYGLLILDLITFFVFLIWYGIKGNKWAWKNNKWKNLEHFNSVQRRWAIFFFIFDILLLGIIQSVLHIFPITKLLT